MNEMKQLQIEHIYFLKWLVKHFKNNIGEELAKVHLSKTNEHLDRKNRFSSIDGLIWYLERIIERKAYSLHNRTMLNFQKEIYEESYFNKFNGK